MDPWELEKFLRRAETSIKGPTNFGVHRKRPNSNAQLGSELDLVTIDPNVRIHLNHPPKVYQATCLPIPQRRPSPALWGLVLSALPAFQIICEHQLLPQDAGLHR